MSKIKIKVDYYDKEQKDLIEKNFPKDFKLLEDFIGKPIDVTLEDFKTYAYFRHQYVKKSGKPQTFLDLKSIAQEWGHYNTYLKLKGDRLVNKFPEKVEATDVSEMIGVAGGLSVASKIYGFTQADWTKIPITTAHKDFDFKHVSCLANRFINIEAKGSIVEDNSRKVSSVSNLKSSITKKKEDDGFKKKYKYKRDTCLGIITVADEKKQLQSWIVDPAIDDFDSPPEKVKLLKRLYFYYSIFRIISKRSYLCLTLANRIKAIELTSDYKNLDKVPLMNYNFDKIKLTDSFINSRSRVRDKKIIGSTFLIAKAIYFIGIETGLIDTIIGQDFDKILSITVSPSTELQTLICKISKRTGQDSFSIDNLAIKSIRQQGEDENFIHFEMNAEIIKNTAGLCIAREEL